MGRMELHTTRESNVTDSEIRVYGVFEHASLPMAYRFSDDFTRMAEARRPDLIREPFQTREGLAVAIMQPAHVITRYQAESIHRDQAIPDEFVHPGLDDGSVSANNKLLAELRKWLENFADQLEDGLNE